MLFCKDYAPTERVAQIHQRKFNKIRDFSKVGVESLGTQRNIRVDNDNS